MFRVFLFFGFFFGTFLLHTTLAQSLSAIFGESGAVSPVPPNVAQYILDIESNRVYLHYFGDEQIFLLALSPKLREYLQDVANTTNLEQMPMVYGVNHLSQGECNWKNVMGWSSSGAGADAKHVFYGREIRNAPDTLYGNAIHLSLGPAEDSEGWTDAEKTENMNFWRAIHEDGESVMVADEFRQFRQDIAEKLQGTFMQRWGSQITTKAHRFVLQMYSAESQNEEHNHGSLFFEMFPTGMPPTTQIVFFEAEDGCKGTPTPTKTLSQLYEMVPSDDESVASVASHVPASVFASMMLVFFAMIVMLVVSRSRRDAVVGAYEEVK